MALTTYYVTPTSGAANTKGAYTEIVASTPYNSSRFHIFFSSGGAANLFFLVDIATGAVGVETVVVSNIAVGETSINTVVGQSLTVDVDIPIGTRISARIQSVTAASIIAFGFLLEDRILASVTNPATYGSNTAASRGTQVDPGGTVSTKGSYVEFSASTSARIDALGLCFTSAAQGTAITGFQSWFVDIATGAGGAETIIIPDLQLSVSPTDDQPRPVLVRLPTSIPSGTRLAVRCSCTVNTATQRLICVTLIGMQEPTPTALVARESVQFSVVRPE